MSTIKNLIEESRKFRKETVPLTLRIPQDLNDFIEEFAGQLSLSKQETMLNLLEEGVSIAKEELKKLDTIDEKLEHYNYHLLNTNKGNNYSDHEWMIKKGYRVFLYENGIGIIAMGIGTGKTISIDYEGKKDECHYQELQEYKVLSRPMPSSEIKKTLNRNVVFLRTMSGVPNGKLLYDVILKDFM